MAFITREGFPTLIIVTILSVILTVLMWLFFPAAFYFVLILFSAVLIIVLNFFRDPERNPPEGRQRVISPADGKIIKIQTVSNDRYMKSDAHLSQYIYECFQRSC